MSDERLKRSAEEFLAAKLSEEGQSQDVELNRAAAISLAPTVWRRVTNAVAEQCKAWNDVTGEETLTIKETFLGDLRIKCAGRPHQLTVHFDSRKLTVTLKNTAREEHEKDVILQIEGCSSGRDAQLVKNDCPANFDLIFLSELRVLAGMSRQI
ncbi:MAG TPA: hypothetical protein VN025_10520 [Candidatus Dormibacteraeota bacterium]|jgi:hypothetical protein|nr:hypothetical protein [Candidatus Dormibacteraeota bacterium]